MQLVYLDALGCSRRGLLILCTYVIYSVLYYSTISVQPRRRRYAPACISLCCELLLYAQLGKRAIAQYLLNIVMADAA